MIDIIGNQSSTSSVSCRFFKDKNKPTGSKKTGFFSRMFRKSQPAEVQTRDELSNYGFQVELSALTYENEELRQEVQTWRSQGLTAKSVKEFQRTIQTLQRRIELHENDMTALNARLHAEERRRTRAEQSLQIERSARTEAERQQPHDTGKPFAFSSIGYEEGLLLLGLHTGEFTAQDLKKRWLQLQTKVHPDHGGTDSLSALLSKAYEVVAARV